MKRRMKLLGIGLVAITVALVFVDYPAAQGTTLFRMDYSAGASMRAGWPKFRNDEARFEYGSTWDAIRVQGGGPQGQDIYRVRHIGAANPSISGGQPYWGWSVTGGPFIGGSVLGPSQGSSLF